MKKARKAVNDDELRPEYKVSDFPKGFVRGKYVKRLQKSSNVIVVDSEVSDIFPNGASVNAALRELAGIARRSGRLRPGRRSRV
jgi:hypothetical protein